MALLRRVTADSLPVAQETNVQAYLDRVEKVEAEASSLLAKTLKLEEQRQLLEFKNRVLTEMVSPADLALSSSCGSMFDLAYTASSFSTRFTKGHVRVKKGAVEGGSIEVGVSSCCDERC